MAQNEEREKQVETKFELVGEEEETKNWKGMVLSVIVIAAVFSMVITAIVVNRPDVVESNKTKLTLDNLIENFNPRNFDGNWVSDSKFTYLGDDKNIYLFNCDGLNSSLIVSNHTIVPLVGDQFSFKMSADSNIVLFAFDRLSFNRHSFTARYKIFNVQNLRVMDVMAPSAFENVPLQNAQLSPDAQKLAFVDKNDIYLMKDYMNGEKNVIQVTDDGKENTIYNGITDWLYEEEIFHDTNSIFWSPNSQFMAFVKFDDSEVKEFVLPLYSGEPYSRQESLRYPKVDTTNPRVDVFIYNTVDGKKVSIEAPDSVKKGFKDYYVWSVKFFSESELIVVYVNREQNKSITVVYDVASGSAKTEKEYPSRESNAWNTPKDLEISQASNLYFQIWYIDNYANVLAFNCKTGNVKQITSHLFDVTEILNVNDKTGEIYYIGTNGDPKQRHIFRKKFQVNSDAECLTCQDAEDLPSEFTEPSKNQVEFDDSEKCLYHSASFSLNGNYYALECLGDRIPITYIKSTQNKNVNYVYEDNEEFRELISSKLLPKKSFVTVVLDEETGEKADAELYYPTEFSPLDTMYPVLIFTYGGPSSQIVDYRFHIKKFEAYLANNFNVIVASIDGRGTGASGSNFMKSVYKKLGKLEMHDQFKLAETLHNELYTDDSKFAIWGWSYGGFLSALSLLNETSPFQCGISGAPVTDWALYNTAYTERYLGSFKEDHKPYDDSSLLHFAEKNAAFYSRRSMLLVHGTGDDNVHFQNSAVLANLLRNTNLDLDFEVYPNDKHTPSDGNQRVLFKKMARFLLDCYDIDYKKHLEALNLHHLIVLPPPPPAE